MSHGPRRCSISVPVAAVAGMVVPGALASAVAFLISALGDLLAPDVGPRGRCKRQGDRDSDLALPGSGTNRLSMRGTPRSACHSLEPDQTQHSHITSLRAVINRLLVVDRAGCLRLWSNAPVADPYFYAAAFRVKSSASAADRVERRGPGGALAMPCAYRAELTQLGMAQATTAVTRSAWTRASQT